jgi:DNA-binding MarR family transcriptional regulator
MVVQSSKPVPAQLDLGHLSLFLGLRVNELVVQRLAKAGMTRVRESHGYVIQHLIEKERSISDLAARMGVSQQASSKMVAELVSLGILQLTKARDRRTKVVRLSPYGWEVVRFGRRARAELHSRLVRQIGKRRYDAARAIVLECLDKMGGISAIKNRKIRTPT